MEEQEKNKKKWVKFDTHTWKNVLSETLGPNSIFVRLACKKFFTFVQYWACKSPPSLVGSPPFLLGSHTPRYQSKNEKKTQKPAYNRAVRGSHDKFSSNRDNFDIIAIISQ